MAARVVVSDRPEEDSSVVCALHGTPRPIADRHALIRTMVCVALRVPLDVDRSVSLPARVVRAEPDGAGLAFGRLGDEQRAGLRHTFQGGDAIPALRRAQELLVELGPILVAMRMLAP
jgi:hypothetical protein